MKTSHRILAAVLVLISIFLYFPVNRLVSGGYNLELPIDQKIPLIPIFVVPYLIATLFWLITIVYICLTQKRDFVVMACTVFIMAGIISVIIYVVLPTYVTNRPVILDNDFFSQLLKFVYSNDQAYNAAPSGHTFFTIISVYFLQKVFPKYKFVMYPFAVIVLLSTLFTRQHNVLDVIIGIAFAYIVIKIGEWANNERLFAK